MATGSVLCSFATDTSSFALAVLIAFGITASEGLVQSHRGQAQSKCSYYIVDIPATTVESFIERRNRGEGSWVINQTPSGQQIFYRPVQTSVRASTLVLEHRILDLPTGVPLRTGQEIQNLREGRLPNGLNILMPPFSVGYMTCDSGSSYAIIGVDGSGRLLAGPNTGFIVLSNQ